MADDKMELQQFIGVIDKVKAALENLRKYKGNKHYQKQLAVSLKELNRSHKFLKANIDKTDKTKIKEKYEVVNKAVSDILSDNRNDEKLATIERLERYWPEIEIEFESLRFSIKSFDVPDELPRTEYRIDIEEAIKDFDYGCFISALALCRRSYEGALVALYKSKTHKDPVEEIKCKHCNNLIRDKAYMGITKLHHWAISNNLITDKLKQVGFLLTDMGAGAAHPPLSEFSRDIEMSRLGITATLALLKEIHSVKKA